VAEVDFEQRVAAVRRFNRFYTRQIGVLGEGYLESPFSLTQVRVLYELAHCETTTATDLGKELGLDAGYLSRILRDFKKRGLIDKKPSAADGRQSLIWLTEAGHQAFAPLNTRSRDDIGALLSPLAGAEQEQIVEAMYTIERLLGGQPERKTPYVLRPPRAGDMGWVVQRHGALYAREYGWDEQFEALVAGIVAKFVEHYDAKRERCWIAERDGEAVGSVFVVKQSKTVAKLRLLLVDPKARGLGIGAHLVDECIRFARSVGYRKMVLWTNSILYAARHIYQKAGFSLVHSEPYHGFGRDLVGETWERKL
jgi:DNA-binding MarR family transcriptional regulator/N-acetylglutamate synthase-like GNAT family acetyltransferase